jgi:hypothetical protein
MNRLSAHAVSEMTLRPSGDRTLTADAKGRCVETRAIIITIRIPDDLARGLEGIAAAQKKSVEQLAIERLRSFLEGPNIASILAAND